MPGYRRALGFVSVTALISFVFAAGVVTWPFVQPFRNAVDFLSHVTATSPWVVAGVVIGVLGIYLVKRRGANGDTSSRNDELSLPQPREDREPSVSVPRTTEVEPLDSTISRGRGRSGPSDESGDTASEDGGTDSDAISEPDSGDQRDPEIENPLTVDSTEEEQPEEATTQDGNHLEETDDSNIDLTVAQIDSDDYQYDWVTETDVEMADVGGLGEVKEELRQDIVRPMREEPEKAEKFGIPLPNVLLHGPPGTGKTYLAKALASELEYPFAHLTGSDITSKWVNESTEQVGKLFAEAEDLAGETGGAVIFIDELDAVLPERQMDSHEEDRKVVNEFLSHLQESARERVLFLGATNKREDLDSAAVRNGRIDKEIFVGKPDHEARVGIFEAQLDDRPHDVTEREIEALAEKTSGVVAADIESLVNQAARHAAYGRGGDRIEAGDIERHLD